MLPLGATNSIYRTDGQHQRPEEGGQIGQRSEQEVQATHLVQSTGSQQSQMLQVALDPAPVSLGEIENIAGHFFVALFKRDVEMHFPAGASQQRCLDEVMAEDFSA